MRSNPRILMLALGVSTAAVLNCGCKKAAETKQEGGRVELRSAETEAHRTDKKVVDEKNAYFAVVRREQLQLRARVQEQIDAIDKQLAALKVEFRDGRYVQDPRSKNAAKIDELLERRRLLEEDANVLERADERGWDEVKGEIERDLSEKAAPGKGRGGRI
jgi:hypothetical protein